jgi:16S rRNA G966 N2-methylase RsmD
MATLDNRDSPADDTPAANGFGPAALQPDRASSTARDTTQEADPDTAPDTDSWTAPGAAPTGATDAEPSVASAAINRIPREYRLTYAGKQSETEIVLGTPALPFQRIRAFGAVVDDAWHNILIGGDNLPALRRLMDMRAEGVLVSADGVEGVRLVYIDPPFASEEDYETKSGTIAYADKVAGAKFIESLRKRLVLLRAVMAADSTIFVHLDTRKSHYIKVICDEVFGEQSFRNEIIWKRTNARTTADRWPRVHDVILVYAKGRGSGFIPEIIAAEASKAPHTLITGSDGLKYQTYELTAPGVTRAGDSGTPWRDFAPSAMGRHWANALAVREEWDRLGLIHWPGRNGFPRRRAATPYRHEDRMVPVSDVWTDIDRLNQADRSRVYPTQKPEELVARILESSSKKGDLVLDCFAGSGTTLAVAEKLGRRWIGVDLGLNAIYTIQKRLLNIATSWALETEVDGQVRAFGAAAQSSGAETYSSGAPTQSFGGATQSVDASSQADGGEDESANGDDEEDESNDPRDDGAGAAAAIEGPLSPPAKPERAPRRAPKRPYGRQPAPFAVYSSGHYDFHQLRALPFGAYRTFVLRLFGAVAQGAIINGIAIDGRDGRGDPVIVYDFGVDDAPVTIDYLEELASFLGGRVDERILFIAPAASLAFFEDRVTSGGITFEVRRVPYSAIAALARRAIQPASEADINKIIETESFDFVVPPTVEWEIDVEGRVLTITGFRSRAIARDLTEEARGFPSLAMVLVDYDHDGSVFDLDRVLFAEDIRHDGWRVRLPKARRGETIAVSVCDIYGNEHVQVFRDQEWGSTDQALGST